MKINQAKHHIILKVLKAVRGSLLEQATFVCCAADTAARKRVISGHDRDIFVEFIRERLEGCYTVTEWVSRQGFITKNIPDHQKLDYRQRWVESMIKEFSK